jgi:hypothetical protein
MVAAHALPRGVCKRALQMVVRFVLGNRGGPLSFRLSMGDA